MTLVLGTLLGIAFFVFQQLGWWTIHLQSPRNCSGISSLLFVIFSQTASAPSAEVVERFTYKKALINQENEGLPWYQNYLYWRCFYSCA